MSDDLNRQPTYSTQPLGLQGVSTAKESWLQAEPFSIAADIRNTKDRCLESL
jgi:hypothetical protein